MDSTTTLTAEQQDAVPALAMTAATVVSLHQASAQLLDAMELMAVYEKYKPGSSLNPSLPGGIGAKLPFLAAAAHGDLEALGTFLKYGFNLNPQRPEISFLLKCIWMSSKLITSYPYSAFPNLYNTLLKTIRFLIENGAVFGSNGCFSTYDATGLSSLIYLCQRYGNDGVETVRLALAHGMKEKGLLKSVLDGAMTGGGSLTDKNYQSKILQLLIDFGFKLDD